MEYHEAQAGIIYLRAIIADMEESARGIPDEDRAAYFGGWVGRRLEAMSLIDIVAACDRADAMGAQGRGFLRSYLDRIQELSDLLELVAE